MKLVAFALEIEHAIDHVFEHFWACEGTFFCYVADEEHDCACFFCELHEAHGDFTDLADAAVGGG